MAAVNMSTELITPIPLLINHFQLEIFTSNPNRRKIFDLNKFSNVTNLSVHTVNLYFLNVPSYVRIYSIRASV